MSKFGWMSGKEFLEKEMPRRDFIINNILREKDSMILVGNEKSGKSLFIFQLICSLTSKHPFIDRFEVTKESKVTYIQLEGEIEDSQDRMKRMVKTLDINPELFQIMFLPTLNLEEKGSMLNVVKEIKNYHVPDVVIIDPLYFAFDGDLNDNKVIRKVLSHVRIMKDILGCSVILVHHTHKLRFNMFGGKLDEGDDVLFGSKFLKAWPDHVILFHYDVKTNTRIFSCTTQRSGDVTKECTLRLVEPDPLYFEECVDHRQNSHQLILDLLSKEEFKDGLPVQDIIDKANVSRTIFYRSIKELLTSGKVIKKTDSRPVVYRAKGDTK